MGQATSLPAAAAPRATGRGLHVLVDLDNAAFGVGRTKNDMDYACMERRVSALHEAARSMSPRGHAAAVRLFCNRATRALLVRNGFPRMAEVHAIADNAPDGADHALLRQLLRLRDGQAAVVVTSDRTLARLATYLRPDGLRFATFGSCDRVVVRERDRFAPLAFRDAAELDRFAESLRVFRERSAHTRADGRSAPPPPKGAVPVA